jgi:hypothetical protein
MASNPNLLQSILAAAKGQYAAGPPVGAPSAGVGSVMDARNMALRGSMPALPQQTAPAAPSNLVAPQDLSGAQGPFGSRAGEVRLDNQGNPMTGFSGVKRSPGL